MKLGDKLYVVTRKDLSPGYQAVQSIHAARQFNHEHRDIDDVWFKESNFIALLSVEDENALMRLALKANQLGIMFSIFFEPDVGDEVTAIALEPGDASKELCKELSIALIK